jgi:hypothetical protein
MRSECARRLPFRFISHGPLQRVVRRSATVIAEADVVLVRRGYASKRRWATPPVDRSWDDSVAGFVAARRWSRSSGKSIRWGVAKCDLQRAAVDGLPLRRIDEVRLQTLRSRRLTSALSGRLPPRPARCVRMRSECARRFAFRFISHGPLQRIVRRSATVISEADVVLVRRGYASKRRWATPPVDRS